MDYDVVKTYLDKQKNKAVEEYDFIRQKANNVQNERELMLT